MIWLTIRQLKSKLSWKRLQAARQLGSWGDTGRAAVPNLVTALADESWEVRQAAAQALARIDHAVGEVDGTSAWRSGSTGRSL